MTCSILIMYILLLSTMVHFSADDILKYVSYFSKETGFDISCKLSPMEIICMRCHILFSEKKKKKKPTKKKKQQQKNKKTRNKKKNNNKKHNKQTNKKTYTKKKTQKNKKQKKKQTKKPPTKTGKYHEFSPAGFA